MSNSTLRAAYETAHAAYAAASAKVHEVYARDSAAMEAEHKGRNWREYEKDPAYIAAKAPYDAAMKASHEAHNACRAAATAWAREVAAEVNKVAYPVPAVTVVKSKNGKKNIFKVDGVKDRESSRDYTHLLLVLVVDTETNKIAWETVSMYSGKASSLQAEALKRSIYVHGDTNLLKDGKPCAPSKVVFAGWKVVQVVAG